MRRWPHGPWCLEGRPEELVQFVRADLLLETAPEAWWTPYLRQGILVVVIRPVVPEASGHADAHGLFRSGESCA